MNKKLMKEQKLPSKDDVINTVINGIGIRGLYLEGYRIQIEKSNLYESICNLFDVETSDKSSSEENNQGEAISDWGKVKVYSKIYNENFPDTIFIFVSTQDGNPLFKAYEYGGPIKPFDDCTIRNYIKDDGWFIK